MSRKSRTPPDRVKPVSGKTFPAAAPGTPDRAGPAVLGVCVTLFVAVLLVFGRSVWFDFVDFDDPGNVSENPFVTRGLSPDSILWAFSHTQVGDWIPLTTLSHQLACQLFGLWAGGHHLINVLLHAATSVLLFLVLRDMTGSFWRCAFVAAIFALHPLRAESVAWITERKDLLSGLFFMLTLGAYTRWTRHPDRSRVWVLVFLALGLLSKTMLVTTPVVLLLLDYWPLRRTAHTPFSRRLIEKIPLFLLSIAAAVGQIVAARPGIGSVDSYPIARRAANAVVACATYVTQVVWPANLAGFYPYPRHGVDTFALIASFALLVAISAAAFRWRRQAPWFAVGWLWYLVMLAPVVGLIQAGEISRADRYTYLPQIGLYLIIAWTAATWCAARPQRRVLVGTLAAASLATLSLLAFRQTGFWKDSETLWNRALACTSNNDTAHYNLGRVLLQKGRPDEAVAHFQKAIDIKPRYAEAHYNLGIVLGQKGQVEEAIARYRKALEIDPDYADAHNNLGSALFRAGRVDDAIPHFEDALRINPGDAKAHNNLATALAQKGRGAEAVTHYQKVLKIDPDHAKARVSLAWLLATSPEEGVRDGPKAVALAEEANQLAGGTNPTMLRTLAAARAETGRFEEALQTAQRALDLASAQGNEDLSRSLRAEIELYKAGRPVR